MNIITQNVVSEWSFYTPKSYRDPFNEVALDIVFTGENGQILRVPAFWAGGNIWRVRFSSHHLGHYKFKTHCSDSTNRDMHDLQGEFRVVPYQGSNRLYRHGPVGISSSHRYFEHQDGTPFLWLGDTWWMGLCDRIDWPDGFQSLCRDRANKGFNVIQIVAGLYPDMPPFDDRSKNEAGFPWEKEFTRINPAYFDLADQRISYMVECGLVPCLVGCWGYFLDFMGIEKVKKHWRYLVARYGAFPVLWCAAGESLMPYYLHPLFNDRPKYEPSIKAGWTDVIRYIHSIDPFNRPLSIHPIYERLSRSEIEDPAIIDFDMIQAGAGGYNTFPGAMRVLNEGLAAQSTMPTFLGETVYEGIFEGCREEIQRLYFWSSVLSGAKGYTYGANGLWQANSQECPYGASPPGYAYNGPAWDKAAQLPGSRQLGLAKKLLDQYDWWNLEPHPEWVEFGEICPVYTSEAGKYFVPKCAGIPQRLRIVYFTCGPYLANLTQIARLEPGLVYDAFLFNPSDGSRIDLGKAAADHHGYWKVVPPILRDWVLILSRCP